MPVSWVAATIFSLLAMAPEGAVTGRSSCPVRFLDIPKTVSASSQVEAVSLSGAPGEIELIMVDSRKGGGGGLLVVRAESVGSQAIYGSFRIRGEVVTKTYPAAQDLRGLVWDSAAEDRKGRPESAIEVRPGHYRVMITYLSSPNRGGRSGPLEVCLAMSPTFEVVRPLQFLMIVEEPSVLAPGHHKEKGAVP